MLKSYALNPEEHQVLHHVHTMRLTPTSYEADTRILLHLEDAVKEGYTKVSICTVHINVLE